MLGNLLQPEINELVSKQDWWGLRAILGEMDPPDIAEIIEDLPDEQEDVAIFRVMNREQASQVFSYLHLEHQEALLKSLSNDQACSVLQGMSPDDQTRLLEELPAEVTRRILESLSPDELKAARDLLGYPAGTAGRYMTPNYVSLKSNFTVAQALQHIKKTGRGKETLNVLYIIDDTGKLIQDIRLGTLVMSDDNAIVGEIDDRAVVSIPASMTGEEVVTEFEKYDRVALPVVDNDCRMLGIITADDVLEFAEKKATREMQKLGGSEALDAPYFETGFWPMVKKRGGWLAALFLGETLTATAMGKYERAIELAPVLALFVPLIISSGGNSGSQATSILIRSLALQEVRLGEWWKVFKKELISSVSLGTFLGAIGFVRICIWYWAGWQQYEGHPYLMSLTIWLSLIGVVTFGSLTGAMLPFLLRRIGFDPATASAPFVATLVDVTGLIIYFTIASMILKGVLL